ncbi:MAG: hypothetical protein R2834_00755 [Rhodothermales bacterium]
MNIRVFLVLFCLAGLAPAANAQFRGSSVQFSPPDGAPLDVNYISVPDSTSLRDLYGRMPIIDYPVVVVKAAVFSAGVAIVRDLEKQKALYAERDHEWQRVDSIQAVKLAKLEEIISLQEMRVEAHASANRQLLEQIDYLNEQLTQSVELTEKSLRGRQVRNIYIGMLGGAVGFSLASLIALASQ